jgi:hypothetical protein
MDNIEQKIIDYGYSLIQTPNADLILLHHLSNIVDKLQYTLYLNRLKRIFKKEPVQLNIHDIKFSCDPIKKTWSIEYRHVTDMYNPNDYNCNSESDDECIEPVRRVTYVTFGCNRDKEYYIKGKGCTKRIRVYTPCNKKILRIVNQEYDAELDISEQEQLVNKYAENNNLPEIGALKVFIFMKYNDVSNKEFIRYMTSMEQLETPKAFNKK